MSRPSPGSSTVLTATRSVSLPWTALTPPPTDSHGGAGYQQRDLALSLDCLDKFVDLASGAARVLVALTAVVVFLELFLRRIDVEVVIVTDIGCSGLADKYFRTNAFHGLHGRSVTYATGIKLANPELKVIVLMGDGGCGIGGHHLINAARRNIGVTVVVFNNFNYGMTGGEHSVTTPEGGVTSSTPFGQLEHPMDICHAFHLY